MLKKPEVGQVVVTREAKCRWSGFPEGTIGKIIAVRPGMLTPLLIEVKAGEEIWFHCPKCLRRPKKGETL